MNKDEYINNFYEYLCYKKEEYQNTNNFLSLHKISYEFIFDFYFGLPLNNFKKHLININKLSKHLHLNNEILKKILDDNKYKHEIIYNVYYINYDMIIDVCLKCDNEYSKYIINGINIINNHIYILLNNNIK